MEKFSLDQLKNSLIGEKGSKIRDDYEFDLNMKVISHIIKQIRSEKKLTQQELGAKIGVQKSQISRIENSLKNANLFTVKKIFEALDAQITFQVSIDGKKSEFII